MRLIKLLVFAFILLLQIRCTAFKSQEKEITFESQGTQFSGTLCIPKKPQAAVVFVHGSGAQTRNILLARRFVKNGIAAFVYDKRGIGKSGGNYQDNFDSLTKSNIELLAKDASSAVEAIIKHKEIRDVPIGMVGIRQAGWIIPLAAQNNSKVAFIGLWSGPVCSVL
jgi:alpha-beta hydrolase superfamily lysophospholipase